MGSQQDDRTQTSAVELDRLLAGRFGLLIDGRIVEAGTGRRYTDESPVTQEAIVEVPDGDQEDIARAVGAATRASGAWRRTPPLERARLVREMASILRDHRDELAALDTVDIGNPISAMQRDIEIAAELMELFSGWALQLKGEVIPGASQRLHVVVRRPYGIVGRIVAFNHPIMFSAGKIAAPLVAGNTVILKPPDIAPLSALRMGELFAEALPPGVLSVVVGQGPATGRALVRHPAVRRVAFTGSVTTGRAIQRDAADVGVKHVSLELGGKNALILCPDADLDAAAAAAVTGAGFAGGQGQSCGSTSRLLVHESVKEEILERIVDRVGRIRVGSPFDPATEMGTMASRAQYEKALRYIALGVEEGATVVCGGGPPSGPGLERGLYLAPTVLDGVEPQMRVAQEEIFGPVLSVMTWNDPEEAVRIANGVEYGLTGAVFTNDLGLAHRLAQGLDAGYVWINEVGPHYPGVPFGGVKASGVGREESFEELESYAELQAINMRIGE